MLRITELFRKKRISIRYYTQSGEKVKHAKGVTQLPFGGDYRIAVKPGDSSTIMMGMSVNLPKDTAALVLLNPGMCTVKGLYQDFPELLPAGYSGDVRIRVTNRSKQLCYIAQNAYIAMLIPIHSPAVTFDQRGMREVDLAGYNQLDDR